MTVRDRLRALAEERSLPEGAESALAAYLDLLAADAHAPTAVRVPERAVDVHVADALSGLEIPDLRSATAIADLGAGAGAPGVVLAAALPSATVQLVESTKRKCAFLERAVEAMGLTNVSVVAARAEEWPAGLGRCDAVTARALAPLPVLVEYAAPLLTIGGVLVAWKGAVDDAERAAGSAAAATLGLEEAAVTVVEPYPSAGPRRLYLYRKVRSTPNGYPRRAGMARKRPVGTSTTG